MSRKQQNQDASSAQVKKKLREAEAEEGEVRVSDEDEDVHTQRELSEGSSNSLSETVKRTFDVVKSITQLLQDSLHSTNSEALKTEIRALLDVVNEAVSNSRLEGRRTVFFGSTGVGKSFIINLILQLCALDERTYSSAAFDAERSSWAERANLSQDVKQLRLEACANTTAKNLRVIQEDVDEPFKKNNPNLDAIACIREWTRAGHLKPKFQPFVLPAVNEGKPCTPFPIHIKYGRTFHLEVEYLDESSLLARARSYVSVAMRPDNIGRLHALTSSAEYRMWLALCANSADDNNPESLKKPIKLREEILGVAGKTQVYVAKGDRDFDKDRFCVRRTLAVLLGVDGNDGERERNARRVAAMKRVTIHVPCPMLDGGEFIDAPGINDANTLREVVLADVLRTAETIVVVSRGSIQSDENLRNHFMPPGRGEVPNGAKQALLAFLSNLVLHPDALSLIFLTYSDASPHARPCLDNVLDDAVRADVEKMRASNERVTRDFLNAPLQSLLHYVREQNPSSSRIPASVDDMYTSNRVQIISPFLTLFTGIQLHRFNWSELIKSIKEENEQVSEKFCSFEVVARFTCGWELLGALTGGRLTQCRALAISLQTDLRARLLRLRERASSATSVAPHDADNAFSEEQVTQFRKLRGRNGLHKLMEELRSWTMKEVSKDLDEAAQQFMAKAFSQSLQAIEEKLLKDLPGAAGRLSDEDLHEALDPVFEGLAPSFSLYNYLYAWVTDRSAMLWQQLDGFIRPNLRGVLQRTCAQIIEQFRRLLGFDVPDLRQQLDALIEERVKAFFSVRQHPLTQPGLLKHLDLSNVLQALLRSQLASPPPDWRDAFRDRHWLRARLDAIKETVEDALKNYLNEGVSMLCNRFMGKKDGRFRGLLMPVLRGAIPEIPPAQSPKKGGKRRSPKRSRRSVNEKAPAAADKIANTSAAGPSIGAGSDEHLRALESALEAQLQALARLVKEVDALLSSDSLLGEQVAEALPRTALYQYWKAKVSHAGAKQREPIPLSTSIKTQPMSQVVNRTLTQAGGKITSKLLSDALAMLIEPPQATMRSRSVAERFRTILGPHNLEAVDVPADGNCLYHALADQLFDLKTEDERDDFAVFLKSYVLSYISTVYDDDGPKAQEFLQSTGETAREYVRRLTPERYYGDATFIRYFCCAFPGTAVTLWIEQSPQPILLSSQDDELDVGRIPNMLHLGALRLDGSVGDPNHWISVRRKPAPQGPASASPHVPSTKHASSKNVASQHAASEGALSPRKSASSPPTIDRFEHFRKCVFVLDVNTVYHDLRILENLRARFGSNEITFAMSKVQREEILRHLKDNSPAKKPRRNLASAATSWIRDLEKTPGLFCVQSIKDYEDARMDLDVRGQEVARRDDAHTLWFTRELSRNGRLAVALSNDSDMGMSFVGKNIEFKVMRIRDLVELWDSHPRVNSTVEEYFRRYLVPERKITKPALRSAETGKRPRDEHDGDAS